MNGAAEVGSGTPEDYLVVERRLRTETLGMKGAKVM